MKATTRKYNRILDAQSKIYKAIAKLPCYGDNWLKNKDKVEKLEQKLNEYENKLTTLSSLITQEAFEVYKTAKEKHIKEIAEEWKNLISNKVYEILITYKIQ